MHNVDPADSVDRIGRWCATGGLAVDGDWSRNELKEHVRDEHSMFRWLLEPMIGRCGCIIESAEYSEDDIVAKYLLQRR